MLSGSCVSAARSEMLLRVSVCRSSRCAPGPSRTGSIAEAIYEQAKDVVVAVLLRMDEQIQRLEKRVAQQDERIAQLERRLDRSSRNSSQPPSADPPSVRRGAARIRRGEQRTVAGRQAASLGFQPRPSLTTSPSAARPGSTR
jgi:hypothetical protein